MPINLKEFLSDKKRKQFATDRGTDEHARMQRIIIDGADGRGDDELIAQIKRMPELLPLFSPDASTEVPIAGKINGKFVSRRIDRMRVCDAVKSVTFVDYKTDSDHQIFKDKYINQMNEYAKLLSDVYPGYQVCGYILWMNDFTLEKIS